MAGSLIEEFHLPFVHTVDPDKRWLFLPQLIPWEELVNSSYAPHSAHDRSSCKISALGIWRSLIKQRLV